jgi:hypothetical protein
VALMRETYVTRLSPSRWPVIGGVSTRPHGVVAWEIYERQRERLGFSDIEIGEWVRRCIYPTASTRARQLWGRVDA